MAWCWRGRGRGGDRTGPWPGRGPFSYLPPWQRPGWLFGFSRGFGRWLWGYPYNPWVCARFPWLPRWWWANPAYSPGYGAGYGYPPAQLLSQQYSYPPQYYAYPPPPRYGYRYVAYPSYW